MSKQLLEDFDRIIAEKANSLYRKLQYPKVEDEIVQILSDFGISDGLARNQLVELYSWKDGVGYDPFEYTNRYNFCSRGVLLPLSFVSAVSAMRDDYEWEPELLPIVGDYAGDYLLFDTNENSPTYLMLLLHSKSNLSLSSMITYFDTLFSMINTIVECFNKDVFKYVDNVGLDYDFDEMIKAARRLNPKSKYWQQF